MNEAVPQSRYLSELSLRECSVARLAERLAARLQKLSLVQLQAPVLAVAFLVAPLPT